MGSRFRRLVAVAAAAVLVASACSGADDPLLVQAEPTVTPTVEPTATPPRPTPTPVPTATPEPTPTATPEPTPVPALTRGVSDERIRIGVLKTGDVFGDVEVGVEARLARTNADGGVAGRLVEVVVVADDGGDVTAAVQEAARLVETEDLFAVVLASAVPAPEVTDVFERAAMPFFGWGFSPGFCEPSSWGFGINGCVIARALGIDEGVDAAPRALIDALTGAEPTVALAVSADAAGDASAGLAAEVWGERLMEVVIDRPDDTAAVADDLAAAGAEAVLLSVPLDRAVAIKGALRGLVDVPVIDDVSYLPGLLSDVAVADQLEGSYAITTFPPQEEYREVTGVIAQDLADATGNLVYSQAVTIGWWSADLVVTLLGAVGEPLDTASFHQAANVDGVRWDSGFEGGLCPVDTLEIRRRPAGGAALVKVDGGIYFPAVAFSCF